jgi:hypothetical protein
MADLVAHDDLDGKACGFDVFGRRQDDDAALGHRHSAA